MKRLVIAALGVATAVVTAPPAAAGHTGYTGGCAYVAVQDNSPNGALGGQDQWNGTITVRADATDNAGNPAPLYSISVDCELRINGVSQGVVYSTSTPGVGWAAGTGSLSYTAQPTDIVALCDIVTVEGETHYGPC